MDSSLQYKKAVWHSRRGMLELDELLIPFAYNVLPTIDHNEQMKYIKLISMEDNTLYNYLIKSKTPSQTSLISIIQKIKHYAVNKLKS